MATIFTPFPVQNTTPYLTEDEVRSAPLSRGVEHFFHGLSDTEDGSAIRALIRRVSRQADSICEQPIAACVDVEQRRVPVLLGDMVAIKTRYGPIREVRSVFAGHDAASLVELDLASAEVEPNRIWVPSAANRVGLTVLAKWTYVPGYPVTTLAAAVVAGATTIQVASAAGITVGDTQLTIPDSTSTEVVTPTAVVGAVLTVPPLLFDHPAGTAVTSIPDDVKQACLLLLDASLDFADTYSLTVTKDDRGGTKPAELRKAKIAAAEEMLESCWSPRKRKRENAQAGGQPMRRR